MNRTHRLCALASLVACSACPLTGPDKLSELEHVRPAVLIRSSGVTVFVAVNYDEGASGGCAYLHTDFGGTANGAALIANNLGGHSTSSCSPPAVSGVVPIDPASLVIVVSDSSKRIELEVRNALESTISIGRCVGAERCDVTGPNGTATLPGTN